MQGAVYPSSVDSLTMGTTWPHRSGGIGVNDILVPPLQRTATFVAHPLSYLRLREVGDVASASQSLLVTRRLPFFDRLYRVDQHQDIQGEVISDQDC